MRPDDGLLPTTKGSPLGERHYWIVSEAELEGAPECEHRSAPQGATGFRRVTTDSSVACPSVR